MNNIINEKKIIDKCQIFTPKEYAYKILDYAGYKRNLYGKKILENSCGDGQILKRIVELYIKDLLKNNIEVNEIKKGLENDIYGLEIDKVHFNNCIHNLELVANKFNIKNVNWSIFNENALKKKWDFKFDYIIGNPPYIAYRDLDINIRNFLRNNYISCKKGRFDYCYSFIEEGIENLNEGGKFAYIIPNSIFKNVFGQELRNFLLPFVEKIVDFKSKRLFKTALTTTAFLICEKNKKRNYKYINYINIESNEEIKLLKENLKNNKWIFFKNFNENTNILKRFGDYFNAAMAVATLHNKTFVIKNFEKIDNNYIFLSDGYKLENHILRKGASPLGMKKEKSEYIIFPYQYINNELTRFTEVEIKQLYPETLKYLNNHKEILLKRTLDKNINWFEYGKTQALKHLNTEKLLLSSLITNKINCYYLNEDYIPYSGIYIIKKGNLSLKKAKEILESNDFFEYIKKVGKNANGNTIKITAKDINNYKFK